MEAKQNTSAVFKSNGKLKVVSNSDATRKKNDLLSPKETSENGLLSVSNSSDDFTDDADILFVDEYVDLGESMSEAHKETCMEPKAAIENTYTEAKLVLETSKNIAASSETAIASKTGDFVYNDKINDLILCRTEKLTDKIEVKQGEVTSEKDVPTVTLDDSSDDVLTDAKDNKDEKSAATETKEEKVKEAEDSDDDIIFLEDKNVLIILDGEDDKPLIKEYIIATTAPTEIDDCEKVKSLDEKKQVEKAGETKKDNFVIKSQLDIDNSVNEYDKLGAEKGKLVTNKEEESQTVDDNNTNFLQEARTASSDRTAQKEEAEGGDNGNDDESAIELSEGVYEKKVSTAAPPAKRILLSEVAHEVGKSMKSSSATSAQGIYRDIIANKITKSDAGAKIFKVENDIKVESPASGKRSHDALQINDTTDIIPESDEVFNKKQRSEDESKQATTDQAKIETKTTETQNIEDKQEEDNFPIGTVNISSHRYRKQFNEMTRENLENFVYAKLIEALAYKDKCAELRDLGERQEKVIIKQRKRIFELSKQIRDMEIVHEHLQKDIEMKNSQVVMPVKRPDAVQVFLPTKRDNETVSAPMNNRSISDLPTIGASSTRRTSSQMPPPRNEMRTGSSTIASEAAAEAAAAPINSLHGYAQKVAPLRPMMENPVSSQNSGLGAHRAVLQTQATNSQTTEITQAIQGMLQQQATHRLLNKTTDLQQRSYISGPYETDVRYQSKLKQHHQISQQLQLQNSSIPKMLLKRSTVSKVVQQQTQRRAEPVNTTASPAMGNYMTSLNQVAPTTGSIMIIPPKPIKKAFIDLKDVGEVATSTAPRTVRPAASTAPLTVCPAASTVPPIFRPAASTVPPIFRPAASTVPPIFRPAASTAPPIFRAGPVAMITALSASAAQYGSNRPPLLTRMSVDKVTATNQMQIPRQQCSIINPQNNINRNLSHVTSPTGTSITRFHINTPITQRQIYVHPAPPPAPPTGWKLPPPRPIIRISKEDNGIIISWNMEEITENHAECVGYQIYAHQETNGPPMVDSWHFLGEVKAMMLPMAVTLTLFEEGQRYFFTVRAVDPDQRVGPFSLPKTWS